MKFIIVFVALFAVAFASSDSDAQVLRNDADVQPDGFKSSYETSNGISAQEDGHLVNVGTEHEAIVVKGSYQYTAPDGTPIQVSYVADENGFQPQGAHLPVA